MSATAPGFTPLYRGGGDGPPLVLIHGFTDSWRTWELVLPALAERFDVLALTLPGHAGGAELPDPIGEDSLLDGVEAILDAQGLTGPAAIAGNSLGGYTALRLAERGRATSVVALAPAGGWAAGSGGPEAAFAHFLTVRELLQSAAPHADAIAATPEGRRQATAIITERSDHIPAELVAHQIRAAAACPAVLPLIELARTAGYPLDLAAVTCPVRFVWGTEDKLLPWPSAAARFQAELPHADWVVLDGVGHCPQLDVPVEAAKLIAGWAAGHP